MPQYQLDKQHCITQRISVIMRIEKIKAMARQYFGVGKYAEACILGAEWADDNPVHENINTLAREAYDNAVIRSKTTKYPSHEDNFFSIFEEFKELKEASEFIKSEHLPEYSETAEELADVLIACLTELHKRDVNIEAILRAKINYNKTRV